MSDFQSNDIQELINTEKQRRDFYQAEVAKMESAFLKLGLVDKHMKVCDEVVEPLNKLNQLQNKFSDVKELSANALALSYADRLRKHKNYSVKIKMCIKLYMELNATLLNRIRELKSYYDEEEQQIDHIVTVDDDIKTIKKKISRYEQEVMRMEKNNPWLKNPEYSLPNISKEIGFLKKAQELKKELLEELNRYFGLRPDLVEANEQLAQIKLEYQETCNKLK